MITTSLVRSKVVFLNKAFSPREKSTASQASTLNLHVARHCVHLDASDALVLGLGVGDLWDQRFGQHGVMLTWVPDFFY